MEFGNGTNDTDTSHVPLFWEQALIIISGTLLAVSTAGGNLLVIISFKIDRRLQTISNYFLLSLAVADFTIGIISCPFMTLYTAQGEWSLGYTTCQFWLSTDYLMSNASVWNLLLISLDRFLSVTKPLTYRPMRTSRKAIVTIVSTFVFSMILWPPWIIAWPYIDGHFEVASNACMVQFLITNIPVTIATIVVSFYLPVSIMIGLYARVYYETQKRQKDMQKLQGFQRSKRNSKGEIQTDKSKKGTNTTLSRQSTRQTLEMTHFGQSSSRLKITRLLTFLRKTSKSRRDSYMPTDGSSFTLSDDNQSRMDSTAGSFDRSRPGSVWMRRKTQATSMASTTECKNYGTATTPNQLSPLLSDKTALANVVVNKAVVDTDATGTSGAASNEASYRVVINLGQTALDDVKIYVDVKEKELGPRLSDPLPQHSNKDEKDITPRTSRDPSPSPNAKRKSITPMMDHINISDDVAKGLKPYSRSTSSPANNGNAVTLCNTAVVTHEKGEKAQTQRASLTPTARKQARRERKIQDSKAAKTLSAILLVFILTWAPYSIFVVIEAFRPKTIPLQLYTFSYYLCYMNSTINPLCYALCNTNFRQTYVRILTFKCFQKPPPQRPMGHVTGYAGAGVNLRTKVV